MFKSILAIASAALIAFTIAQPASAGWNNGVSLNGGGENGTLLNGGGNNGTFLNGGGNNGTFLNGGGSNGTFLNGGCLLGAAPATSAFAIDDIELPAATR